MKIEHIAMYVNDLEVAREFFIKYFDGKSNTMYHNKNTGFKSYFISFDDGSRLEIMSKDNVENIDKSAEYMGYTHIAFSVGSEDKVNQLTDKLKNDGYKVLSGPRTTGDGYYESCIFAFEGNRIELNV